MKHNTVVIKSPAGCSKGHKDDWKGSRNYSICNNLVPGDKSAKASVQLRARLIFTRHELSTEQQEGNKRVCVFV